MVGVCSYLIVDSHLLSSPRLALSSHLVSSHSCLALVSGASRGSPALMEMAREVGFGDSYVWGPMFPFGSSQKDMEGPPWSVGEAVRHIGPKTSALLLDQQ